MAFVRVFNNVFLNPLHVGKGDCVPSYSDPANGPQIRTTVTKLFDATGINVLLEVETTVTLGQVTADRISEVAIDNRIHDEIMVALAEGRNALTREQIIEAIKLEAPSRSA